MKEINRNFIAKVTWYNEIDLGESIDYVTLQAESYGLAADKIEEFYKDILIGFEIFELEEGAVSFITEDCYNRMLKGDIN